MPRLPPAEKLPLAVRKNIRDEWESKKADFEKKLSDVLGTAWDIDINPNAIYPYAEEDSYGKTSLGSCIASYVDGAIDQIKYFETHHGEEGLAEINDICGAHVLTMDLDEGKKFSYCGVVVTEGKLCIVFNEKNLGTNISYALELSNLLKALNEAPAGSGTSSASKISFAARTGIRQDYDAKIEDVRKKIADMLNKPDIKLVPNFDDAFAKLAAERKRKGNDLREDWEASLGQYTFSYFESVMSTMDYQKFGEDDMLQEGFNEAVDKGEIAFRIVEKLSYDSYCECVVEGGVLYLQTTAAKWGSNIHYAAQKLVDQL